MIHEFVIIGGGVSGLAAANRLIDLGVTPLVIEGQSYPKQAVCGEVISSQAIELLKGWDIHPNQSLHSVKFFQDSRLFAEIDFEGATFSRDKLEKALYERALSKGAQILTNTKVDNIVYSCPFGLELNNQSQVFAKRLLISAGRHFSFYAKKTKIPIVGKKAHYENFEMESHLEMHLFPYGYAGIAPVDGKTINIATLCKKETPLPHSVQEKINQGTLSSWGWLEVEIPKFGTKKLPNWENAYFFGDTRSTIPPISGEGVTMALISGVLAATCAYNDQQKLFESEWKNTFQSPLRWGNYLHKAALSPPLCKTALHLMRLFPSLGTFLHKKTEII